MCKEVGRVKKFIVCVKVGDMYKCGISYFKKLCVYQRWG